MRSTSDIDQALAAAVRRLRAERHDTQEDLAHRAGLTVAAFARIERGQANPSWATVKRIAAALDLNVAELAQAAERRGVE